MMIFQSCTESGFVTIINGSSDLHSHILHQDIVETTPYDPSDPNFTAETLTKTLLGSINRMLDLSGSASSVDH